ncbi:hypothetical protein IWGMT90018_41030 [Mycobacterium kiyosense]|nr:hypothetical protein IWGMT90018_41030 [Mycobacterium kiyosense]
MPAIRHHSLTIDHLHVFVREAGDRDRPTLVLLPGYPSSTRAYVRLIDRLAEQWHCVAIDYPASGQSDPLCPNPHVRPARRGHPVRRSTRSPLETTPSTCSTGAPVTASASPSA